MRNGDRLDPDLVRAIIFDIDGTLSDSDDQMVARVAQLLRPLRFALSDDARRAAARWLVMAAESPGNFLYNMADRLSLDSFLIKQLDRASQQRKQRVKKYWIIPGVVEMLARAAQRMPLAVVSARDEHSSLAFIRQFHLEPYFKTIVTSQTCEHTKPFPDPLLYAARQLSVAPENCLMVGDTTVDMRAARLAGMQALGVLCGFGTQRELLRAGAHEILDSTAEVLDLLENRLKRAG
jgi:HAD superfamily hydrolase (TIGR01549 family)